MQPATAGIILKTVEEPLNGERQKCEPRRRAHGQNRPGQSRSQQEHGKRPVCRGIFDAEALEAKSTLGFLACPLIILLT